MDPCGLGEAFLTPRTARRKPSTPSPTCTRTARALPHRPSAARARLDRPPKHAFFSSPTPLRPTSRSTTSSPTPSPRARHPSQASWRCPTGWEPPPGKFHRPISTPGCPQRRHKPRAPSLMRSSSSDPEPRSPRDRFIGPPIAKATALSPPSLGRFFNSVSATRSSPLVEILRVVAHHVRDAQGSHPLVRAATAREDEGSKKARAHPPKEMGPTQCTGSLPRRSME